MDKTQRNIWQIAVMALFALSCFGLLLFLWLSFGGSAPLLAKGYRVNVPMKEVSGLSVAADVRISGVSVGNVAKFEREGDHTRVEVEIDSEYAPLPRNSKAILRRKTLLGEAFVELTPGDRSGPKLPEGGTMATANVEPTVELDEIFQSFDDETRANLKAWFRGWSAAVNGRAPEISSIFGNLPGTIEAGEDVLSVLRAQQAATRTLVRDAGRTLDTFGRQESRTQELVLAGEQMFGAFARRERDLAATIHEFPAFLRATDATLVALRALAGPGTPLLRDLRPGVRALRPTLAKAAEVSPDLESLASELDRVLDVSGDGLNAVSRLTASARPLLDQLWPFGRYLAPVADAANLYRRELSNSWPKVGAATKARAYDPATGRLAHYLRAYIVIPNETFIGSTRRQPYSRPNAYAEPGGIRAFDDGFAKAFDCSHTSNTANIPPLGPAPPCIVQGPVTFRGKTQQFVHVEPAPR